jgi:hypothetical protein
MNQQTSPLDPAEDFRKVLNRHGYGFQYSVMAFIDKLRRERRCNWDLVAPEFPVAVQGKSTRIDFVYRKAQPHVYLVGECKRVNPRLSNWCFSSSFYARGESRLDRMIFPYAWVPLTDKVSEPVLPHAQAVRMLTGIVSEPIPGIYHVGRSVRSDQTGDNGGRDSDAIEYAAGQACRGLNGLVEFFNARRVDLPKNEKLYFMPAIFTTARLWTTDVDLADAQIENDELKPDSISVKEVPWLWYQYHQSPELRHTAPTDEEDPVSPFDLAGVLKREFIRTIAIVTWNGIEDFLRQGFPYR